MIDIQKEAEDDGLPSDDELNYWVESALEPNNKGSELTVRIVELEESRTLNNQYRHKDKPTNVLSFPFENPPGLELPLLGDLVICAPVVRAEAKEQNKSLTAHWAHMVIHGTLHLQGYDHIQAADAEIMEAKEVVYLQKLGFPDPY